MSKSFLFVLITIGIDMKIQSYNYGYKYFGFKSKCSFHSLDEIMYVESDIIHVEPLSHLTFQSEFEYIKPSLRIGVKYEDN